MSALNDEAISARRHRTDLKYRINHVRRERDALSKTLTELERREELAREVDKVVDGIALKGGGCDWAAVDEDISRRFTDSYTNVRDGGIGLHFREWRVNGGYDEVACIISQPRSTARRRALAWVLRGELPESERAWAGRRVEQ